MAGPPRTKTAPEMELLICAAAVSPDPVATERLVYLVPQVEDMEGLVDLAIREGLACLLYKNLRRAKILDRIEQTLREKLQAWYRDTVAANLRMIHDLKEILGPLNRMRIRVVLLQGVALLQDVYRDPGLRPMRDIDLWVLEDQLPHFRELLLGLGYRQDTAYPNSFRRGSTLMDVHTHILWADRVRAMACLLAGGQERLFRVALPISFEGHEALRLQPVDEALYLALHILKHSAGKLLWLVDLHSLIRNWAKEDWLSLAARAGELNLERPMSQVLHLLRRFFLFRLPAEVSRVLGEERLGLLENRVLARRVPGRPLPFFAPLLLFTAGRNLKARLSLVTETLFPSPEILRQILPGCGSAGLWFLYWKRFCYLFRQVLISLRGKV
ncbi:MAG: nucleotidyltransferase family protein [Thermodesulfobacteriota bacterium]